MLSSIKRLFTDALDNWACMLHARGSEHTSNLFTTLACTTVDMIQL